MKKVLFVLTSHGELGDSGEKTGLWLDLFATPFYFLKDKGVKITLASPKGGHPPIDPKSIEPDYQSAATRRFNTDENSQDILANTLELKTVNQADYDAVFYPGGYGPLWDLVEDENSIALIEDFYKNRKPVSAVCHAPAIFKNAKHTDGSSLISGRRVTGFTNSEEKALQLASDLPFLIENMLRSRGAIYSKSENGTPHAIEDGFLITGQNSASCKVVAELLLEKIQ